MSLNIKHAVDGLVFIDKIQALQHLPDPQEEVMKAVSRLRNRDNIIKELETPCPL